MSETRLKSARGFAMPAVLLAVASMGAIAVAVISRGAAEVSSAEAVARGSRDRLLLDAGLARGILALVSGNDPMTELLHRDGIVDWSFADQKLVISLWPETAKLDLNMADPNALAQLLNATLGHDLGSSALAAALGNRGRLTSTDQILPMAHRFAEAGSRLRDVATVYGGQVQNRETDPQTGDVVAGTATVSRPIYTVRVRIAGTPRARSVTVLVKPESHRYVILERAELDSSDAEDNQ